MTIKHIFVPKHVWQFRENVSPAPNTVSAGESISSSTGTGMLQGFPGKRTIPASCALSDGGLSAHALSSGNEQTSGTVSGSMSPAHRLTKKDLLKAWSPYIAIAVILLVTRIPAFGLRSLMNSLAIHVPSILGNTALSYDLALLYSPGLIPFLLVSVVLLIVKRKDLREGDVKAVLSRTGKQVLGIAIALVSSVGMVQIMIGSGNNASGLAGMLTIISTGLIHSVGSYFPVISPLLGVFGAFVSGSCTVSGILFGPLQFETAHMLGLSESSIIALQMAGGAIGNMICVHNVIAVASTTSVTGQEGKIISTNILPCLIYTALVLAVYAIF